MKDIFLKVENLKVYFDIPNSGFFAGKSPLKAIDGVSFQLARGETLGVVGESGCGKSTLGRALLRLVESSDGKVIWMGDDLDRLDARSMRQKRKDMQIIFQDPLASLNPRMTIGEIIVEPLRTFYSKMPRSEMQKKVNKMMARVGLLPEMINRYPHEFSGGQCQRIGIARAMILEPRLIICDEPVSALDVSIQAQIVNLLQDLQKEFAMSLIFISHDLSIVRHISHRIMVLYLGRVMEIAAAARIYSEPRHPYTKALISAVPIPDPDIETKKQRIVLEGDLPSPLMQPTGCVFRTRCPYADGQCAETIPAFEDVSAQHRIACHKWQDI